ncbi:ribonuclease H-like domain-containing protein [Tanacetum coccineum]
MRHSGTGLPKCLTADKSITHTPHNNRPAANPKPYAEWAHKHQETRRKNYKLLIKSAFLYGTIEEEVYVSQPPGFVDPEFLEKVYKVEKALYGLHQAPRACLKTASTPMETNKDLTKDEDGEDVDVHLYRFQVQPKVSHLNAVKRIFRYLKGQPNLGLWYPKDSSLILEAFLDSDYAGASLDRKSTTRGKRGQDTKIPQSGGPHIKVGDKAIHKELGDRIERAATTASSFEAEQDNATARTSANGEVKLTATINGQVKIITEASLRRHLKLEDNGGVTTLPNSEIFEQLALMGAPETSPSRITSSPSLSLQHTPVSTLSTSQPPNTQPTPDAEEAVPMPHESPLHSVHSLGRDQGSLLLSELTVLCTNLSNKVTSFEAELAQTNQTYGTALTKLIKKVKTLEQTVKSTQAKRRFRIVVSDDEESLEDPSKQGRKITKINQDPSISLVHDEGTSWIQEDIEIQEKISDDTEVVLEEEEPTKLVEDLGSGENREKEVSTIGVDHSTVIPEVSTAAVNLVYIRRSAQKRKDKGKAIMQESEPPKKVKKRVQVQMSMDEDWMKGKKLLLKAQKIDWSDPAVLRYHAQLNRPYSVAEVRKNMVMYLKNQGGYKMNYFKGMKYEDIRPIFEKVWDQIQSFAPMDSEKEKGSEKKGSRKKTLARKRASGKDSEESMKKQKLEDDTENEDLKAYLDLVPREEFAMEIESLATKYPIVDWKTHVLTENFMYYQIIRADGGSKNYKIFSEMLDDFDRQDVMDLHRLVEERYATSRPEGYDLMLWGDLKILFQPDEEDEVWRHQHEYNLISWRLFDSCGIHILLMDNGIAIHMMIEKKYPLTQEMLSKMLSRKLEVDHENEMAFELLRFIRSQVQK